MLHWLGKFSVRRPIAFFLLWAVALGAAGVAAFQGFGQGALFDRLSSSLPQDPNSESAIANEWLSEADEGQALIFRLDGNWQEKPAELQRALEEGLERFDFEYTLVSPLVAPQEYLDAVRETATEEIEAAVREQVSAGIEEAVRSSLAPSIPVELVDVAVARALAEQLEPAVAAALPAALETGLGEALAAAEEDFLSNIPELRDLTADESAIVIVTAENELTSDELAELQKATFDTGDVEVTWSTAALIQEQLQEQSSKDLVTGELISLPIALVVMLVIFGGFIAAAMPLIGGAAAIVSGLATLWAFSFIMDIDTTVMSIITVIGLGVSIDYGLLFISRYRELLRSEQPTDKEGLAEVMGKTVNSAGRTIIFSAATIAIAVGGLLAIPIPFMWSVAVSAASVVLLAGLAVVTLLPAILGAVGIRITRPSVIGRVPGFGKLTRALGDVAPEEGFFTKAVALVRKAPALWLFASVMALLAFGSSILTLQVASSGTPLLANERGAYGFFQALERDIPTFKQPTARLVFEEPEQFEEWATTLDELGEDFTHEDGSRVVAFTEADPLELRELRDSKELPGLVTGIAAEDHDFNQALLSGIPLAALIIFITTFILLFLLTGSLFVPLKAIIFSVLSLGASIGVLTWGFEGSGLAWLFGFEAGSITAMSPIILVLAIVFGFGLSMDYAVFLMARMKEERDRLVSEAGPNVTRAERDELARRAVSTGLQATGRVITFAGLIIMLVFLGFTFGELLMIKQIGVALAVAVVVDMVLVRIIAVPATMLLMGDAAWWAPKPLKKLQEKIGVRH